MEQIQTMRSALRDVPLTLLTTDDARILVGVFSSLDIIEKSQAERPVVVLVGPTGAGKSFVFNAIIGADASPEGVLRPTTSAVFVAGDLPSNHLRYVQDAVTLPIADIGFTLVEIPDSEFGHLDANGLVAGADLVVMVVSAIRYADASVTALWRTLDHSRATLVLNRVATDAIETRDLTASVTEVFGVEPYVISERDELTASIADHIAAQIPRRRSDAVASIMFRSGVAGARYIVQEVTSTAADIGKVTSSLEGIPDCAVDTSRYGVQEAWAGTRDGIVKRVAIDIRDRDDDIMRGSGAELAERVLASIGPWDEEDLATALDTWRDLCITTFSDRSSVRWRRSNAHQLIEQFSWSTAINDRTVAPKRFPRIMGKSLGTTTRQMQAGLEDLICGHLDARLGEWRARLERIGEYRPGALASAADAIERQRSVRD